MKKYFAKYLPVEVEIKAGDTCKTFLHLPSLNKQGLGKEDYTGDDIFVVGEIQKDRYVQKDAGTWYYKEECQKVKLFLCSRDIQVGDKAWVDGTPIIEPDFHIIYEIKDNMIKAAGKWWDTKQMPDPWKKIGEISPEAKWVKEGDEFDEEEIIRTLKEGDFAGREFNKEEIRSFVGNSHKNVLIKIKCSNCQHFH